MTYGEAVQIVDVMREAVGGAGPCDGGVIYVGRAEYVALRQVATLGDGEHFYGYPVVRVMLSSHFQLVPSPAAVSAARADRDAKLLRQMAEEVTGSCMLIYSNKAAAQWLTMAADRVERGVPL